ncbi:D-glycero-alpha-D-manno-heptose-1,7-bisphosphate 7-phosphatase [Helicobacter vulpis]|uniref:D-glycero-alpha-D-manno-heptose-1,7-bisphosphate 7-phosphatase n=1 Tax=Helicobacter vulpis TaxID=2316076 RepID=UPI001F1C9CBF|nr:HAD family hydrolase [Helicobacter vulpis]
MFLDRDGVINVDKGYVCRIADFVFMPGIFELLSVAKAQGFLLLLVTNQSGIARGYYSVQDFWNLSAHMQTCLQAKVGFGLDKIYFCPHAPHTCACRKPGLGMLEQALRDFDLNLGQSCMLGDKFSDMQFGLQGGIGLNLWLEGSIEKANFQKLVCISDLKQALGFLKD